MQQAINKSEFISNLSANCDNMADTIVDDAVREILNLMTHTLANDGRVEVRGFGSFCLHHRRARVGRNPKTGRAYQFLLKRFHTLSQVKHYVKQSMIK
ncbi:integration host factor subunit beta [Psychrobacter sp. KH172YL61]|uniref:HU family DNA-binding protein n=1 Tax=Psychrobacter sp. KH172YL61 TaxID=2517899 RepID=UPI0010B80954|nr:integration host factor subunit beta [Psychrobacter sp. KH172YL61]